MRKENRAAAGAAAWQVVRNTGGRVSVWQRVRAVPRMLAAKLRGRYPQLGNGKLFGMLLMVGYIVSPIDFVPELFFSVFGLVDDVGVAVWLTTMMLGESERYVDWEREDAARQAAVGQETGDHGPRTDGAHRDGPADPDTAHPRR